jgi:hypothetical protein
MGVPPPPLPWQPGSAEEELEAQLGLRCRCGRRITVGWRYYVMDSGLDPASLTPVTRSGTFAVCGDSGCLVTAWCGEYGFAREALVVEWVAPRRDVAFEAPSANGGGPDLGLPDHS